MTRINMLSALLGLLSALFAAPSDAATQYTYDELNRLTKVLYDDGRSLSYSYDAAGNLLQIVRAGGVELTAGKLTDTGITSEQCFKARTGEIGSQFFLVSCSSAAALALSDQQDGMVGRDVSHPDSSDGKLGFSYSLVGSHDRTECVKDNITGLTWEGKTANASDLRYNASTFTNYGDGRSGDASAYVTALNAAALCGYSDWRLPTVFELQGIVDYGVASPGPTVDALWFVNTKPSHYWSSSISAAAPTRPQFVSFFYGGFTYSQGKGDRLMVRAVR